jgi:hypothetical protein
MLGMTEAKIRFFCNSMSQMDLVMSEIRINEKTVFDTNTKKERYYPLFSLMF